MAKHRKVKKKNTKKNSAQQVVNQTGRSGKKLSIRIPRKVETGAPELVAMYCSHCGGALEVLDTAHARCPFCEAVFLIDQPEDLNVNIFLPGDFGILKKLKELSALLAAIFLYFLPYIIGVLLPVLAGAALMAGIDHLKKSDLDPAVKQFYEDALGNDYKKLSADDFNRIKYFEVVWGEPVEGEFTLYYSFEDYVRRESDETFEATRLKWDEVTDGFNPYPIYDRLHGLTYIVLSDKNKNCIPQDAPITCVAASDIDTVNEKICGNDPARKEKLEILRLKYYHSSDIEKFAQFTNLKELSLQEASFDLSKNAMDVSALAACTELEILALGSSGSQPFIGLAKLGELKDLRELYLPAATLDQCSFLTGLTKLEKLTLKAGERHDVSSLQNLSGLKYLCLTDEYINLSELPKLPDLEELYCVVPNQQESDQVVRFANLKRCRLKAAWSNLSGWDVSALERMEHLEYLSLYSFMSPDISHLESVLNLKNIQEIRITSFSDMPRKIYIDTEKLTEESPLKILYMPACYPYDQRTLEPSYEMFSHLTKLESLVMRECKLEDVSFLRGMPNLQELNVERNNIYDYSPLADCPKLQTLYLGGNPIVDPGLPDWIEFIPYDTSRY